MFRSMSSAKAWMKALSPKISGALPLSLSDRSTWNRIRFAFFRKRRHFCPSCHQKRVLEFGAWLCMNVIKKVPRRHFFFSLPKMLHRYFLFDRKRLADLSCCAWESLKVFLQEAVPQKEALIQNRVRSVFFKAAFF